VEGNNIIYFFIVFILLLFFFWITNILKGSGTEDSRYHADRKILKIVEVILAILVLVVFYGQLAVFSSQKELMKNQNKIFEESTVSNRPEILIWSYLGPLNIDYPGFLETIEKNRAYSIKIGVTNLGKVQIPWASIELDRKGIYSGHYSGPTRDEYTWILTNIKSLSDVEASFSVSLKESFVSRFKPGVNNITFEIACPICEIPIQKQEIDFCFHNTSIKEDCGESWWIN